MDTPHVILDIGSEVVAGKTDTLVTYDTTERDYGNLSATTAYIDNHVTLRRLDIKTDTESSSHRLINHVYVASAGMLR